MSDFARLSNAVREASERPDVRESVQSLYQDVMGEIKQRRPVCQLSGRCCRFEEYGHRLFVTTMELGVFVAQLDGDQGRRFALPLLGDGGKGCPFQVGKMCGVHAIRPFGCRMFFCDETATQWQQEQYEKFHARLKQLHDELDVPYFYVEWRAGLAAIGFDSFAAAVVE